MLVYISTLNAKMYCNNIRLFEYASHQTMNRFLLPLSDYCLRANTKCYNHATVPHNFVEISRV